MPELTRNVHWPRKPVYLRKDAATAAKQVAPFMSFLACFFNYALQPVNSEKAQVIDGYYLESYIRKDFLSLPSDLTNYSRSFDWQVPEMWILTLKLQDDSLLAVLVEEHIYNGYIDPEGRTIPGKSLRIDYRQGRFDGVPRLCETGNGITRVPWYAKN